MYSTTTNVFAFDPLLSNWAAIMNTVETMPDSTFTRTGVPRRSLKTPNQPAKAPS